MLSKIAELSRTGGLAALLVLGGSTLSSAQVSFYGAPPPSDFSQEVSVDDNIQDGPIGQGIFADLPFTFSFAVREGYDDNVFSTNANKVDSFYTNWAGGVGYSFGNDRLKLNSTLNGGVTYYYTRPGDKVDFNGQFAVDAVYLATPKLTLTLNTSTQYLSQPDYDILGSTNQQNGDYVFSTTSLAAAYQWSEKFSTVTSYSLTALYYLEKELNDNQGHIDQVIAQSARWLILPRTTGVVEYRANPVTYFEADLNSFNNFFLIGVDQVFNPRFTWNVRAGAQLGFLNNPVDGKSTYLGPYGESTMIYQFGPRSSFTWLARYGTEASGLNNVTQRQTFRTGFTLLHGFTPRISANLGFNYQNNYYTQTNVIDSYYENIVSATAGLSFKVNRWLNLQGGYQFSIDMAPEETGREYTRNVVFVGVDTTF